MPEPGGHVPAPESGPTAIKLVDPERCGNGHPWVRGDPSWSRQRWNCLCTEGERGHWTWSHDCGWSLTVPPHDPKHKRQVY